MNFQHEPGRIFHLDPDGTLLAEITFPVKNGVADIDHTYVKEDLRGTGIAGQLMNDATNQIRAAGLKAKATCPYAVKWFALHPKEQDLLDSVQTER